MIAHFLSHALPSTHDVVGHSNGRTGTQRLASPLIHPGWFPILPVSIATVVVIGALVALVASQAGYAVSEGREQ